MTDTPYAGTPENTYRQPGRPGRQCRTCGNARGRTWYHRRKEASNV